MANASPLTDAHMRENAANALKHIALFRHVSQRLLADVVSQRGLSYVFPPTDKTVLSTNGLAILIVLEGAIRVLSMSPEQILDAGTYVRTPFGILVAVGPGAEFTAVGSDTVRVFVLDVNQIVQLPRVVVNALDPVQIVDMNNSM